MESQSSSLGEPNPGAVSSSNDASQLEARVANLENRFPTTSWLWGPSFIKRALAMWGHVIVIQLIIAVVIWAVIFACGLLFAGTLGGFGQR
jgi:hypothetical protein